MIMSLIKKFYYCFNNNELYIEKAIIRYTLFCKNLKLSSTIDLNYVFKSNSERFLEDDFEKRVIYKKDIENNNHKKMAKTGLKLLRDRKKKKWIKNQNQRFPSKLLVGVEWDIIIETRRLYYAEYKILKGEKWYIQN